MEITRIGAKRFFCHSSVMWLNTESVPEAFPPPPSLWQSSFLFPAIRFPQSLTISLSVLFHLLLPPSLIWPTSVSHSMVWLVIWLFVSLRWHAPSTSHSLIPLFYFKKKHPVSTLFFLSLSDGPSRSLSHSPFTLLSLGVLFKLFHSRCTPLWLCQTAHPPFVYVYLLYVFLYLNIHLSFTLTPFPSLFLLILPAFLDILRFRVALQSLTAPLWHWSFLDLRGAGSWKLSTGKREYIFALRLSQRHVIVK